MATRYLGQTTLIISKEEGFVFTTRIFYQLFKEMIFVMLQDCLVTELIVNNDRCFITCAYRSPSQSHDELDTFCSNLNILLDNDQ